MPQFKIVVLKHPSTPILNNRFEGLILMIINDHVCRKAQRYLIVV